MTSDGFGKSVLGFQLGSGDKKDTLFAVALVIIVVVAIALTVYQTVFRGSDKDFVFKCRQCGAEFRVDSNDQEVLESPMGPAGVTKPCPKCGGKAFYAVRCPKCRKYKIQTDVTCPSCGVNVSDFVNQKVEEALKKSKKS